MASEWVPGLWNDPYLKVIMIPGKNLTCHINEAPKIPPLIIFNEYCLHSPPRSQRLPTTLDMSAAAPLIKAESLNSPLKLQPNCTSSEDLISGGRQNGESTFSGFVEALRVSLGLLMAGPHQSIPQRVWLYSNSPPACPWVHLVAVIGPPDRW
ncbi:unnamed protein product [Protopolystoma xenopodis]|uniref:Uncharacterized protein n=1 Tax=Protopolystoma xenopodis TaxID=117903 RepID=A0A3S5B211_9PLAT|nr:unnamed protein product [Protopolystoma xenopodis]